jgi:hypothetical protein
VLSGIQADSKRHTIGETGNVRIEGRAEDTVTGVDTKGGASGRIKGDTGEITAASGESLVSGIRHVSGIVIQLPLSRLNLAKVLREIEMWSCQE